MKICQDWTKIVKETLFSEGFLHFTQFGLNLSNPTHQNGLQFGPPDFLTPLTSLAACQYWRYYCFKICFWYSCTKSPSRIFHSFLITNQFYITCIDLTSIKSHNITFSSHKGLTYAVIQAVSAVIWNKSELDRSMHSVYINYYQTTMDQCAPKSAYSDKKKSYGTPCTF